ncbi:MAG: DUF5335 domain-containing protein [Gammaproteobacteria bacterium]|nr:DUF5335 domain-containing protein [Gammaproteobacteria bacterium]
MQDREIAKQDWPDFFDRVTSALQGKLVEIEVDSLELGAQIEATRLSLNGLTYDRKDDSFVVSTDQIEHVIRSPQKIHVADATHGVGSLMVTAADGSKQIIRFTEPLALPKVG